MFRSAPASFDLFGSFLDLLQPRSTEHFSVGAVFYLFKVDDFAGGERGEEGGVRREGWICRDKLLRLGASRFNHF